MRSSVLFGEDDLRVGSHMAMKQDTRNEHDRAGGWGPPVGAVRPCGFGMGHVYGIGPRQAEAVDGADSIRWEDT